MDFCKLTLCLLILSITNLAEAVTSVDYDPAVDDTNMDAMGNIKVSATKVGADDDDAAPANFLVPAKNAMSSCLIELNDSIFNFHALAL